MVNSFKCEEMAAAIVDELSKYTDEVTGKIKEVVDIVAAEVNEEIKNKIPFTQRTGKYVKSFRIKKTYEDKFNKKKTWHVVNGEYRLSHLLEFGHAKRNRGRVQAYPHIIYGEELAKKRMDELIKGAIEG